MSTFYVLPPRSLLGEHFTGYLRTLFPGLGWGQTDWIEFANALGATATRQADVYVVFREDLPEGEDVACALVDGFGAEVGDQIVEVRPGPRPGEMAARRWVLNETMNLANSGAPLAA